MGSSSLATEQRLEEILEGDIDILGLDRLLVIGRQVPTSWGKFIDLLALDPQGEVYVIELKRDRTPREVVAQALDYGSWVRALDYQGLADIWAGHAAKSVEEFGEALKEHFGEDLDELNGSHKLIIVASELDPSTERIVEYLAQFEVPVSVVFFRYLKDGEREYLARSWLASPTEAETKGTRSKKRPWNGQDFYISFGDSDSSRNWDDALKYGFVAGGGSGGTPGVSISFNPATGCLSTSHSAATSGSARWSSRSSLSASSKSRSTAQRSQSCRRRWSPSRWTTTSTIRTSRSTW